MICMAWSSHTTVFKFTYYMSPLAKLVTRSVLDLHYLAKGSGEGYKEYVCVYYLFIKFEVQMQYLLYLKHTLGQVS